MALTPRSIHRHRGTRLSHGVQGFEYGITPVLLLPPLGGLLAKAVLVEVGVYAAVLIAVAVFVPNPIAAVIFALLLASMPPYIGWTYFIYRAHKRVRSEAHHKVRTIIIAMENSYLELDGHGPVSVRRLRAVAEKACEVGVGWPSALSALLDDNLGRAGIL